MVKLDLVKGHLDVVEVEVEELGIDPVFVPGALHFELESRLKFEQHVIIETSVLVVNLYGHFDRDASWEG